MTETRARISAVADFRFVRPGTGGVEGRRAKSTDERMPVGFARWRAVVDSLPTPDHSGMGATNVTNEPTTDSPSDKPSQPSGAARVENNKAASRRWIEVFNQRDDAAEADVRTPDFVAYAPASLEPAPLNGEAWTRFLAGFVEGFPDLHLTVEETVGEGELVAQMIHFEGTHTGDFQGLPPTHRRVTFSGLELNRFVDGQVVEHWFHLDALSLLQQLGLKVVPGPRLLPRILAHQVTKRRTRR